MIHEKLVRDGFEISAKLCLNGFNLLPFCFETLIEKFNLRFKLAVPFLEGKQLFLELGRKRLYFDRTRFGIPPRTFGPLRAGLGSKPRSLFACTSSVRRPSAWDLNCW